MGKLIESQLKAWIRDGQAIAGKSDGAGLTFTLSDKGSAVWVLRYRISGRTREVRIGRYPDIGLQAARILARQARAQVDQGTDVAAERQRAKLIKAQGGTFRDLGEDYLLRVGPRLAAGTRKEAGRFLRKDLYPALGSAWAVDIKPDQVVGTIDRIAKRSKTVARRAFELLSVIFSHGVARCMIPANPCLGLKVSAIIGELKVERERIKLTRQELRDVLAGLPALGRANELAVRILLATCVRKGELLGARWEHVDLARGLWTIPDEASKTGQGFVIPLPHQVAAWFEELKRMPGAETYVLPGRTVRFGQRRTYASRSTLNVALNRLEVGARRFSPHDLRSTARSYLAELGVNILVAERCLNHSLGGLVAIYDKHDYLEERRSALRIWASFLERLEKGEENIPSNVVPLRAA